METEPNVPYYTNLAKERICFCLVKVRERLHLTFQGSRQEMLTVFVFFLLHGPEDVRPLNKLPLGCRHTSSSHSGSLTVFNRSPSASNQFQIKSAAEAIDVCSEAHQRDPRNANVLRDRAEAYILNQDYEKGDAIFSIAANYKKLCLQLPAVCRRFKQSHTVEFKETYHISLHPQVIFTYLFLYYLSSSHQTAGTVSDLIDN